MEKKRFRCASCKKLKPLRAPGQRYCNNPACQKDRKNAWRREKYASDADYRANQKKSTQNYLQSVGGAAAYYQDYRQRKKLAPKIAVPQTSTARPSSRRVPPITTPASKWGPHMKREPSANSDAAFGETPLINGRYLLCPIRVAQGANSDAILVEIAAIT